MRKGRARYRTRGGCSYGAVVPWEDEHQLVRNAGVAHLRWNSHLGIEAFQLGCAFLFGFAALALDDHAYRAPQGFAAPLVAGAAEEAGVEVVEGFFELQVVVAQADEPFTVLLPGPELQRLAGFGGAVGAAGGLQIGQGIALFLIVELLL